MSQSKTLKTRRRNQKAKKQLVRASKQAKKLWNQNVKKVGAGAPKKASS
jgi:hypothetical protein